MTEERTTADLKRVQTAANTASHGSMTLREKLVELRKACPKIIKEKHSDSVSYKYAKIYDVWEAVTPVMNEIGVDFEIVSETATGHAENGDPLYYTTMTTKTRNGERLMFLYEADLGIVWTNVGNESDRIETVIHAIGWNDDPAKAKGAAHTYALKYYLFEKFSIDQGEDDPDNSNHVVQRIQNDRSGRTQGAARSILSPEQLGSMYREGEAVNIAHERVDDYIFKRFGIKNPTEMTMGQYDEVCKKLAQMATNGPKGVRPNE